MYDLLINVILARRCVIRTGLFLEVLYFRLGFTVLGVEVVSGWGGHSITVLLLCRLNTCHPVISSFDPRKSCRVWYLPEYLGISSQSRYSSWDFIPSSPGLCVVLEEHDILMQYNNSSASNRLDSWVNVQFKFVEEHARAVHLAKLRPSGHEKLLHVRRHTWAHTTLVMNQRGSG